MNQLTQIAEFSRVVKELTTESRRNHRYKRRRKHSRQPRSLSLQIQPLDLDLYEDGPPFWAISRDISRRGLGFINSEPVQHEFLRIGLLEHDVHVTGQVRHSTSIGDHYPLYLIGVEFVFET